MQINKYFMAIITTVFIIYPIYSSQKLELGPMSVLTLYNLSEDIQDIIISYLNEYKLSFDIAGAHAKEKFMFGLLIKPISNDLIASAETDAHKACVIKIWDIKNNINKTILEGHRAGIRDLAVIDSNTIVTSSWDKTISVWDTNTGEQIIDIDTKKFIEKITYLGNNKLAGYQHSELQIWDLDRNKPQSLDFESLRRGRLLNKIKEADFIKSIKLLNQDQFLVGLFHGTIMLRDINTGKLVRTFYKSDKQILNSDDLMDSLEVFTVSQECNFLIASYLDKTVNVFDIKTGKCLRTFEQKRPADKIVNLTPTIIAICAKDKIVVYDIITVIKINSLENPKHHDFKCLITLPDNLIATYFEDYKNKKYIIKIWDYKTGNVQEITHPDYMNSLTATEDGALITAGYKDIQVFSSPAIEIRKAKDIYFPEPKISHAKLSQELLDSRCNIL